MKTKEELRKEYLNIRKNILNKDIKSNLIFRKVIATIEYVNANIIAMYMNLPNEVSTYELISYSLQNNKIILLPKVIKDDLVFCKVSSLNDGLIKSSFNILEPIPSIDNVVDKDKIDLMIVPGVCFDRNGNRIGFGKGYYDRYLENTNIKTIGICFKEQIVENEYILTFKHDKKIDTIITD